MAKKTAIFASIVQQYGVCRHNAFKVLAEAGKGKSVLPKVLMTRSSFTRVRVSVYQVSVQDSLAPW